MFSESGGSRVSMLNISQLCGRPGQRQPQSDLNHKAWLTIFYLLLSCVQYIHVCTVWVGMTLGTAEVVFLF